MYRAEFVSDGLFVSPPPPTRFLATLPAFGQQPRERLRAAMGEEELERSELYRSRKLGGTLGCVFPFGAEQLVLPELRRSSMVIGPSQRPPYNRGPRNLARVRPGEYGLDYADALAAERGLVTCAGDEQAFQFVVRLATRYPQEQIWLVAASGECFQLSESAIRRQFPQEIVKSPNLYSRFCRSRPNPVTVPYWFNVVVYLHAEDLLIQERWRQFIWRHRFPVRTFGLLRTKRLVSDDQRLLQMLVGPHLFPIPYSQKVHVTHVYLENVEDYSAYRSAGEKRSRRWRNESLNRYVIGLAQAVCDRSVGEREDIPEAETRALAATRMLSVAIHVEAEEHRTELLEAARRVGLRSNHATRRIYLSWGSVVVLCPLDLVGPAEFFFNVLIEASGDATDARYERRIRNMLLPPDNIRVLRLVPAAQADPNLGRSPTYPESPLGARQRGQNRLSTAKRRRRRTDRGAPPCSVPPKLRKGRV
ncbi:MAG TPA: hypothetical protein VGN57_10755 [Pirellulaceae bacterium]|jgi:hypothetical protein|nr:hypothetical protein [Pirellulaceae bacterium]